jgi:minor extracellular serine protease Vpr
LNACIVDFFKYHYAMKKSLFVSAFVLYSAMSVAQMRVREYSPKLTAQTVRLIDDAGQTRAGLAERRANVYIRLAEGADTARLAAAYGVKFNVRCGDVCTALVPVTKLEALAADAGVAGVDAGQEVHTMMDEVRRLSNVDAAHAGMQLQMPYKGNGVLVGVIDAGFDFCHPNFLDSDGNCRILAAWDQNKFFTTSSSYGYGVEYGTTEDIVAAKRDMELTGDTHGTHVAGIAAGSYDGPYMGVASEADIVLVSTNKTEQGIIDGLDYLLKYAEKAGRPMAINLSIGTVLGYKDGTDDFTVMVDRLLEGSEGRVLSIAAGNEGDRRSTLRGTFEAGNNEMKSLWVQPDYGRDNLFIQGEKGAEYSLTLTLRNTESDTVMFSETFESGDKRSQSFENFGSLAEDNGSMNVSVSENPANGNPCFRISLIYGTPDTERWELSLKAESGAYMVNSDYGEFASGGLTGYIEGTNDCTIAATATGHNTVSVGAYVSKNEYTDLSGGNHKQLWTVGDVYPLSGKGPTYDGRIKPDVVAPGAVVVSSYNSYAGIYYVKPEYKVAEVTGADGSRKYSWGVLSGTSMATPVVTGVVALWLQADPTLTVDDVRDLIEETSVRDSYTGDEPNGVFGYGKIDALAGLKRIVQTSGIYQNIVEGVRCTVSDGVLTVSSDAGLRRVAVYSVDGTQVAASSCSGNEWRFGINRSGVYIIKVETSSGNCALKFAL